MISLNGVDAYIKLPQELLAGKSIYTIELTFSTTQKVAGGADWNSPCICGMLNYGGNIIYITNNNGYVALGVPYGDVGREMLADGKVHRIAIVSDGTKIKGYCEKIQFTQTRDSKVMDNVSINFGVGLPQCRAYAECVIYEARFWDVARSPADLYTQLQGHEVGLRGWYKCQETSGNVLKDSSSNAFDGEVFGIIESTWKHGIHLNGIDNYIELPVALLGGKQTFTIELKFSTTEKRSSSAYWNAPCLCGNSIRGSNNGDINIGIKDGKLIGSIALGYYGDPDIITNDDISDGSVYHITLISDGNTATLYKENVPYPITCGVSRGLASEKLYLGYSLPLGGGRAAMTLCEARFWDIAKKPDELGTEITGEEQGLRGWYKCLETSGSVLKDSSSNGFNGVIFGNIAWPPLPIIDLPTIVKMDGLVLLNCRLISTRGLSITSCGFIIKNSKEDTDPDIYDSEIIPAEGGEFTFSLALPLGSFYIAAYAESAEGRTVSDFIAYTNLAIRDWENGIIYDLQPSKFSHFTIGNILLSRSVVQRVITGDTEI